MKPSFTHHRRILCNISAFQRFSVSAFQRFSVSAFQRFSVSAFQRFSVSAFQRFSVSALACLSLASCQVVTDTLDTGLNVLKTANSVLSGTTSSAGSSGVSIDSHTQASAISAINKATANSDVKKMFLEAKPTIEKMVAMTACATHQSPLNQFTDPDSGLGLPAPLSISYKLKYHKSGCLNVLRINNFKRQAANAFTFTVYYQSPQSEETDNYDYVAIKQPDGEWLFKWR